MDKLRKESKSYMEFQDKLNKFRTDAEKKPNEKVGVINGQVS